ncbi:MAG: stage V sporulation protein AC [Oscillospiraceae bacterium]|nr:stage V sporulation protein AC [Oscillospiraceae bacterium]
MKVNKKEYGDYIKEFCPNSPLWKDVLKAFVIGGLICTIGQMIMDGFTAMGLEQKQAGTATSISLVFLSALLTGLSLYDNIAKHAGAGTLVPITGFANAVAAPAVEFRTEGFVLGTAAKIFTIAGPVIVYGISAGVVYGLIYWVTTLFSM